MRVQTKVIPLSLWELCEEWYTSQGWEPYGYEPMPIPHIVNLRREIPDSVEIMSTESAADRPSKEKI